MSRETTALVVNEHKGPFSLQQVRIGQLGPNEVLVEIAASGICHNDLACAKGLIPTKVPAIFGHEGAGIVVEVADNVTGVEVGDKVLLSYAFCGDCDNCTSHYPQYCAQMFELNFGGQRQDGTSAFSSQDGSKLHAHFFGQSSFARLAVANKNSIVKVTPETPLDLFAPLGCGVQTGAGAILASLDVKPGSTVAIIGVGSVGMSAVMAARLRRASKIIAVDVHSSRLELARELGATHTIDSRSTEDIVPQILRICPPKGVDYALDCTGIPSLIENMIDALAVRGRACSVGTRHPDDRASVNIFKHFTMGRQYVGSHQGDSVAQEMATYLIEQQRNGQFPLEKIITYYDMENYAQAMEDLEKGKVIKAVLRW